MGRDTSRPTRATGNHKRGNKGGNAGGGRTRTGPVLGGHGPDLAGVSLVTVGLVCGLAVYGGLAGPAGRALADGAGSAFGLGRYGVPLALVGAGAIVLYRRALHEHAHNEYGRLGAGLGLVVVAGCGLLQAVACRRSPALLGTHEVIALGVRADLVEVWPVCLAMISSSRRRTSMISFAWISMSVA